LIQRTQRPDSIVARALLVAEFFDSIDPFAKIESVFPAETLVSIACSLTQLALG
jgi:hypothetical protein